jgi:hypothetical protein
MISGGKTRRVFQRYNIVSAGDLHEAVRKMNRTNQDESRIVTQSGHDSVTAGPQLGLGSGKLFSSAERRAGSSPVPGTTF